MAAAASPPTSRGPRRTPRWLVIQTVVILLVPVGLGAVLGWFDLNPVAAELQSSVGSESHLLLNSFPDNRLVVEIAYQDRAGPPPGPSVSTLLSRINETCSKASVTLTEHAFSSAATTFSDADLTSLAQSERTVWPAFGTMSLFYLYLGGGYGASSSVIGLAYLGSTMAVFEGTIVQTAGASGSEAVTTTVLVHEFGHELGLVGVVGSAPNEDQSHPGHSADPSDVMYWAVDSTALLGGLLGGAAPPTQFSTADLSDLNTVKSTPILTEILPWIVVVGAVLSATALAVWQRRALRTQ